HGMVTSQNSIQYEPSKGNEKATEPEPRIGVKTFMKNFLPAKIKQHPGECSGSIVGKRVPEGMDMFFERHARQQESFVGSSGESGAPLPWPGIRRSRLRWVACSR